MRLIPLQREGNILAAIYGSGFQGLGLEKSTRRKARGRRRQRLHWQGPQWRHPDRVQAEPGLHCFGLRVLGQVRGLAVSPLPGFQVHYKPPTVEILTGFEARKKPEKKEQTLNPT